MKKVIVIGSDGSGKSTFARRLGKAFDIEVIHLDQGYWKPNWVKTPKDEWSKIVEGLLDRESWIMDGNFGGTREMRVRACDTVVFLDIPRRICLYRILKRAVLYRGRTRPDMAEGCKERFDWEFVEWVWNYTNRARPRILAQLETFPDKNVISVAICSRNESVFAESLIMLYGMAKR
jgi:adenylate kinase family enzyme